MGEPVTACELCFSDEDLSVILDLGSQPLAERDSEFYPLALQKCSYCGLVQLTYAVDPDELFPPGHPYASGNTRFLHDHFSALAARLNERLQPGDVVVDIGANDGTFLRYIRPDAVRVAVEPTNQAAKIPDGIYVWQEFFTPETADHIGMAHGRARFVTASNVLAHVPNPHQFCESVRILLRDGDGELVTENHDVASILDGLQIDTVYHEHRRYWSPGTLAYLLEQHGLAVTDIEHIPTHGGSFRTWARMLPSGELASRAAAALGSLRELVEDCARKGSVYGVGAATRATPLIHAAGLKTLVAAVCEIRGSDKIGTRMPGTQMPVVDEQALITDQPEFALLFSWHLADGLIAKLREKGYRGTFILPLPEPRLVHGQ
jgi:hypothetical protein